MFDLGIRGSGPTAAILKCLQDAGLTFDNPRDLEFGLLAYNTAFLTWNSYKNSKSVPAKTTDAQRIGRNDPCPCQSGVKFKKCCLAKMANTTGRSGSQNNGLIPFGPAVIPRLTNSLALLDEFSTLAEMMLRDETLRTIRFDASKIEAFLAKASRADSLFLETGGRGLDDMAFRYAGETGEHTLLKGIEEKFQRAAAGAKTAAELRSLAAGSFFSMAYEVQPDSDNPLTAMIFRLSLDSVLRPISTTHKLLEELGDGPEIARQLQSGDFSSFKHRFDNAIGKLSSDDKKALYQRANQTQDNLWDAIDSRSFPVGLPLATVLPFIFESGCFSETKTRRSDREVTAILTDAAKTLCKEDLRLYGCLLDNWLNENSNADSVLISSVTLVAGMVKTENLDPLVPTLILYTCRNNPSCLDEKEAQLIKSWEPPHHSEFLERYAEWLESTGYPALATRTRSLVAIPAKVVTRSFFGVRKNVTTENHTH
jgi:SEC-C motif